MNILQTQQFLHVLILNAGQITLDFRKKPDQLQISHKAYRDYVTEADLAVENFVVETIRRQFPDHGFYGEEIGKVAGNEYRWVIDPIDGTMSFMRGLPFYSISIALEHQGKTMLGAVYLPVLGELFEAASGGISTLNGSPIRVSEQPNLSDSLVITGFACQRLGHTSPNLPHLNRIMPQIQDMRRLGSAAAELCYIACGRCDGFWEMNLNLYDIAAGAFIAEQAGAVVSDFSGKKVGLPSEILCTNGKIHQPLINLLTQ